mmetsp:Transcript_20888/g.32283  ORF Transcript_20888/g.32283 Transcript_20888/m.32283 type:complete len:85 (-) Transcript_20888:2194-2448(-)
MKRHMDGSKSPTSALEETSKSESGEESESEEPVPKKVQKKSPKRNAPKNLQSSQTNLKPLSIKLNLKQVNEDNQKLELAQQQLN